MKSTHKMAFIYAVALVLSISLAIQFASAQTLEQQTANATELSEEELDSVLAPIALYPDTLLTHILIASTYPMDVIRAARWREKNAELDHQEVLERVEVFAWDPSVKALTPFADVLAQMSDDIDWLNFLGDSVIADEEWVLARIQVLRDRAYAAGSLNQNEHLKVEREDDVIVIESVRDRIVYVPFYDTRVVYGNWWHVRTPYYWHHPRHYSYRSGFYWSPSVHIASHFFFGGFNWHHGYVVINNNFHRRYRNDYHYGYKRVYSREYQRWTHNVNHRRARYHDRVVSYRTTRSGGQSKVVRNREFNQRYGEYQQAAPVQLNKHARTIKSNNRIDKQPVLTERRTQSVVRSKAEHRETKMQREQAVDKQRTREVITKSRTTQPVVPSVQSKQPMKQYTQPVRAPKERTVVKQRTSERVTTQSVKRSEPRYESSRPSARQSAPKQSRTPPTVYRSSGNKQKER